MLLSASTVEVTLAVMLPHPAQRKMPKGVQSERFNREATPARQSRSGFQNAGDSAKRNRWPASQSNLRGKRSDPWHRANALPNAMADPALSG